MPAPVIRADYEQLAQIAVVYRQQGDAAGKTLQRLTRTKETLRSGEWVGQGATKFYRDMDSAVLPSIRRLSASLSQGAQVTLQVSRIMKQAEDEAASLFKIDAGAGLLGAAGVAAGVASGVAGDLKGSRQNLEDRRGDRRVDRRARRDDRWRRPPGGRRGGSHLDYDWAGGAILERYLTGGGDWNIDDNSRWTEYMQSNERMTQDLGDRAMDSAQQLYNQMDGGGSNSMTIDESFPMEIENGEGVVGYQYLHGTNSNAGGFERDGTATIEPDGSGGYNVTMDMHYRWNDVIDPNPQYVTDNWKSTVAEITTLGQADAYEIHIGWSERTVVNLDADGNVREIHNE